MYSTRTRLAFERERETNTNDSHAFDLKSSLPYHSLSPNDRDEYWDDGLHLSPAGYDWMGGLVANALIPLIKEEEVAAVAFEEESGSGRANISQGYIIVRKKDLD